MNALFKSKYGDSLVFLPLANLLEKRELILYFSLTEIKIRYKASYLGFLWTALEPLLLFVLLFIVFTTIRDQTENFAIYLIIGVAFYHLFARGTIGGLSSLKVHAGILKSLNVKRELFPVIATGATSILMIVEIGVLLGLMPVFNFVPSWTLILIPITIVFLLLLILGISYFLSVAFVYIRDIQPLWTVFAHSLLFISPIFWYLNEVDGILLEIHKINPLGQIIELTHKIVFGEIPPLIDWIYASGLVALVFIIGYGVFQKYEKYALEEM